MSKKHAVCPSCKQAKYSSEIEKVVSIMESINRSKFANLKGLNAYDSFVDASFEWACDACLNSKKAIPANYSLQGTSGDVHLAYFDSAFNCSICQKSTFFKKEEKKAWYEEYQLPINSHPNECLSCRREIKAKNKQNTTLSELLSEGEEGLNSDELEQIISIYQEWGNNSKQAYFEAKLKKLKN